jgi:hypothetical protein
VRFTSETITDGVSERPFTLGDVPGVLWSPAEAAAPVTVPVEFCCSGTTS